MTSAAALPGAGAALRVVRGAAGRRLVQVVLLVGLVGGLFVLGLLCGERASAAEGAPTSRPLSAAVTDVGDMDVADVAGVTGMVGHAVPPVTEDAVRPVAEHVVRPVTERVVRPVAEDVVRPVTEDVVQPVTDPVLRPVTEHVVVPAGDLVESVTEGLADVPSQFPPVSGMPSLPGIPELPELPGLPEWTMLPVETLPVDVTPQEPGRAEAETPGSTVDGDSGSDGERAAGPASVVYGPHAGDGAAVVVSASHRGAGAGASVGDPPVVRVPAPHGPDGLPTGTLGRHSAVDNGGPRHAEPHAVASLDRAPLSLVPGTTAADAADGTRDRHRDIPEFPG